MKTTVKRRECEDLFERNKFDAFVNENDEIEIHKIKNNFFTGVRILELYSIYQDCDLYILETKNGLFYEVRKR